MNPFCKICAKLFLILSCFSASSSIAADSSYLEFPAERNNLQVLPQKFEFSLRDASKFLLGNRIIDTSQFDFQIDSSASSAQVNLKWPVNVIESGRITLLNPSGVSIWSQEITKDSKGSHSVANAMGLLQQLMQVAFFRFCVNHYEINTGIEVCSPELVVKGTGRALRVSRQNKNVKPSIQINGRPVTPHGIVFLNDAKESLSFRAVAASGAEFRMDTRRINLEFTDVVSVDDNTVQVTVKGPPPLPPIQYKRLSEDKWSILLRKERPLFYVAGEGKVPLRQEFVVQGPLPTEAHRLYLDKNSAKRTYSSTLLLQGQTGQKGTPQSTGESSDVYVAGKKFSWMLRNIATGQERKAYINVHDEAQTFTASYPVARHPATRLEVLAGLNSDDMRFYLGGEAQTWLESMPLLESLTTQRIGLGLIYNQEITGDQKTILMELDVFLRTKIGLQFLDPSWIVGLAVQNWSFDSQSLQTLSPIFGWQGKTPKWLKGFEWQEADLKYSLPKKKGDFELSQNLTARWKIYRKLKDDQRIRYSLGAYMQEVKSDEKHQATGALAEAAWVFTF